MDMKSIFRTALLAALAVAALGVTALAADTGGMYNVTKAGGYTETVTLTPQTAEGNSAAATSMEIDGQPQTLYVDAEKIQVTYTDTAGSQYLVLALDDATGVPTEDNIVYIDQRAADSTGVTFTVYPSSLVSGTTYGIYLSGSGSGDEEGMALTQVASFQYYMPYTLGDVNEDGGINTVDAMCALQMAVQLYYDTWTENQWLAANVNRSSVATNNGVDTVDAMLILQYTVGLITEF